MLSTGILAIAFCLFFFFITDLNYLQFFVERALLWVLLSVLLDVLDLLLVVLVVFLVFIVHLPHRILSVAVLPPSAIILCVILLDMQKKFAKL